MKSLTEFLCPEEQTGKLVVLDNTNEESTVFVLFELDNKSCIVRLVELDRPADSEYLAFDYRKTPIYILEPIDVLERVVEWK